MMKHSFDDVVDGELINNDDGTNINDDVVRFVSALAISYLFELFESTVKSSCNDEHTWYYTIPLSESNICPHNIGSDNVRIMYCNDEPLDEDRAVNVNDLFNVAVESSFVVSISIINGPAPIIGALLTINLGLVGNDVDLVVSVLCHIVCPGDRIVHFEAEESAYQVINDDTVGNVPIASPFVLVNDRSISATISFMSVVGG
jgi:hypothetical protein